MSNLIHVLGSDIPHHNTTVLRFFNEKLSVLCPPAQTRNFMVVAQDCRSFLNCDQLEIERFNSKKAVAKALIRRTISVPEERYFLHGQFNSLLWIAMLTGKIRSESLSWHVWGADLYEDSQYLRHRWFYLLRRRAQGLVRHVFATQGDLVCYRRNHPSVPASLLYFPTRLANNITRVVPNNSSNRPLTLLIGNSGDESNRHSRALHIIYHQFGTNVRIIIPMSYPAGNNNYISTVQMDAERFFSRNQINVLTDQLAFDDYVTLLRQCDVGYFLFPRQQGIGTLSLLIQLGLPFVLSRKNPFCQDLIAQQIPVLYEDDRIDTAMIFNAQQRMLALDPARINFFYPNILQGWSQALSIAAGVLPS